MRDDIDLLLAIIRDTRHYRDRIVYICFVSLFPMPCADSDWNYCKAMKLIRKDRPLLVKRIKALATSRTAPTLGSTSGSVAAMADHPAARTGALIKSPDSID